MTFTGTLIEDLISTVERAERKSLTEAEFASSPLFLEELMIESSAIEPWFASAQGNADYESQLPAWQESGVA